MKTGSISLGTIAWLLILFAGVPPFVWSIMFIFIILGIIYLFFTDWYVDKRYEQLNIDNPDDVDIETWTQKYRKNHPVSSFFYYLFMN